jgi:hypothetical protein
MVNECSESYRNGQELSNAYTYLRHHIPHLLPPPPLAPCSASSLNFFSSEIHSSRVLFLLFCFVFSCVRLRRRSEGHTPLYHATQNFLVRRKSPQQQCKRNQKILKIGNDRAKEHKKLCRFVHATARHGRRAYNEDDDRVVSYSLDKEIMEN